MLYIPKRILHIKLGHVRLQKTVFHPSLFRPHTKVTLCHSPTRLDIGATIPASQTAASPTETYIILTTTRQVLLEEEETEWMRPRHSKT